MTALLESTGSVFDLFYTHNSPCTSYYMLFDKHIRGREFFNNLFLSVFFISSQILVMIFSLCKVHETYINT